MTWTEVPAAVRGAVAAHLDAPITVRDVATGSNADLTAVATTRDGLVFVKAVCGISRQMKWLRNEITGNQAAGAQLAPAVLFHVDLDDEAGRPWLLVGFEHIDGRPVSLAPGSADLDVVGSTLERIAALPAPVEMWPLEQRWAPTDWWRRCAEHSPAAVAGWDLDAMTQLGAAVPYLVAGDRVVHTDLHADQILLTPNGQARVIDWGYPCAGAPWVDSALMVLRLIVAGHDRADAEAWGRNLPTLRDVDPSELDAFACYIAGLWSYFALTRPQGSEYRAQVAREWATWRVGRRTLINAGR